MCFPMSESMPRPPPALENRTMSLALRACLLLLVLRALGGGDTQESAAWRKHEKPRFQALSLLTASLRPLCGLLCPALAYSAAETDTPTPSVIVGEEAVLFQEIPSVFGASKYEQKVTEAPSSITIITAEDIKKNGYRTLADILQSVNGMFITYDRDYNYVGFRGFNRPGDYNSRVLLLVDGHRLNDNIYDQAGVGTESPIMVDLIDRVEIIRGPSSSLYGTNAFLGVINVLTKRGRDLQGGEVAASAGSFDSYTGRATYGNRLANGLEFLLSGSYADSAGPRRLFFQEFNDPSTNNGLAEHADSDRAYNLFAKLSYSDLTLTGGFVSRDKGVPNAHFGTVFNTTHTRDVDQHAYIDLRYEHDFAPFVDVMARIYYDRYYYRGDFFLDKSTTALPALVLNQDHNTGEWWGGEVKLTKRLFDRHRFTLGAEYRSDFRRELTNADTTPFTSYLHENKGLWSGALYVQDEFRLLDNLIINAGGRYDYYSTFGSTLSPRLALIYNLPHTTLKLLYGQAFRAPNAYEQFYTGVGLKANVDLRPEKITTYEMVLERSLGKHMRLSLAGYHYNITGLISQQADPADRLLVFQNVDKIEANGLEVEFHGKWAWGLEGRLSYALQEARNQDTHARLTNSPQHMARFSVSVPLIPDTLFAGLDGRYLSRRKTLKGDRTSPYYVMDLTLFSQNIVKGFELGAGIRNLFNQRYGDPVSDDLRQHVIEQDGRTFWMKLTYGW